MASKKKHLKYRATKAKPTSTSSKAASSVARSAETKQTPVVSKTKTTARPIEKKVFTRLTESQQRIVKKEIWHIVAIAVGILALYGIFWLGFHYAGWSETILRYIPHGQ